MLNNTNNLYDTYTVAKTQKKNTINYISNIYIQKRHK